MFEKPTDNPTKKVSYLSWITLLVFTTIIVSGFFLSFRTIKPGEVGVLVRLGRVTDKVLDPGAHFITPFIDRIMRYDTKKVIYEATTAEKQKGSNADYKDYPVDTNTKDGQQVDIFYTVRFSVDPTKANWIAQNIGSEDSLVEKIVKTDSRIWTRNIPREFEADHLYTGNVVEVQYLIEEKLQPIFEANGIILDEIGIREIKFTSEYVRAIESKQIEAVKIETQKNIAEQAKYNKEATITNAEAAAQEQELQKTTLTSALLQKMWIEKWNGTVPSVVTGNDSLIFQLPQ